MSMNLLCDGKCDCIVKFSVKAGKDSDNGFISLQCSVCQHYTYYKCFGCGKLYIDKNYDKRNIRNHIKTCPQQLLLMQKLASCNKTTEGLHENIIIPEVKEEDEEDDTFMQQENDIVDEDRNILLEVDYNESETILSRSFAPENIELDSHRVPDFGNVISNKYFDQDVKMYRGDEGTLFGGIRGVCWRSRYRVELSEVKLTTNINDARLMFNITNLLNRNTTSTNELLCSVIADITERMSGDFDSENPGIRLPRNKKEADRICLDGKYGIFKNIPCPNVHEVEGHACMQIYDIVSHHLTLGRGMEYTKTPSRERLNTGIHGCLAMSELLQNMMGTSTSSPDDYYTYITTWSDTFLRSYVKQKLNNVWMYTITLPDPNHRATSPYHTYCVAVGAGALDHTCVIDWYSKEIGELMKGRDYYCGSSHQTIHIKLGVVAVLADRPEKAFMLKTALLGTYGQIASWAADIDPDVLPDCDRCFKKRTIALISDRHSKSNLDQCRSCCQWNLKSTSKSRNRILVPNKYPTKSCENSPSAPSDREVGIRYIIPVHQNFEWLIQAVSYAAHNVSAGFWNKGVMTAYLRTCSVSKSLYNHVWKVCNPKSVNDNEETDWSTNVGEDGEIVDGYCPVLTENSTVIPSLWKSSLMMSAYIDCGMHLVFHGVVAYCVEEMDSFLSDHALTPKFERLANNYMLDIQSLRLEWCKMKFFPKTQWQAENELALARIIPFIYGLLFLNLDLPARSNTSLETTHAIQQMFHTLHVLVCILMSPRDPEADEVDEHVKLFLSCCHKFARSYYEKQVTPFWAKTGNFPTLLCLGEQRKRHGPIRWYWEGTSERFIQQLKKALKSMRRSPQYFQRKLANMYKTNVMDGLDEKLNERENSERRSTRMYYQYDSVEQIERKMKLGEVISGFTLKNRNDILMVAYGETHRREFMNCVELKRQNKGVAHKFVGLAYVQFEMTKDKLNFLEEVHVSTTELRMDHYFLMLPLIDSGNFEQHFAVIYNDWDVGDENFKKGLPNLCPSCFHTNGL